MHLLRLPQHIPAAKVETMFAASRRLLILHDQRNISAVMNADREVGEGHPWLVPLRCTRHEKTSTPYFLSDPKHCCVLVNAKP